MATRFREQDEFIIATAPRAKLRLVEPAVGAPRPAADSSAIASAKLLPPTWMIAPPYSAALENSMREQLGYYPVTLIEASMSSEPYRSVRDVPRAG